ncbi:hypothetical protein D1007_14289 [Hordeum vulgare]|nr:hypothetical protein D1007_14289 [Hordeum vulgare]
MGTWDGAIITHLHATRTFLHLLPLRKTARDPISEQVTSLLLSRPRPTNGSCQQEGKGRGSRRRAALMPSRISMEDFGPLVASDTDEGRATDIRPSSAAPSSLVKTAYPFFLHSIYAGLVPPFSDFFYAILSHYQIQALHLQPNSVLLLAIFAFYCEAFVGVRPSVALFRHFFSLRFTAPGQRSACISFIDVAGAGSHLKAPTRRSLISSTPLGLHGRAPRESAPGDTHGSARANLRVEPQKAHRPDGGACLGVNRRSCGGLPDGGERDPMRLHVGGLTHDELDGALGALLGSNPKDLPPATPSLYACDNVKELVAKMPVFDEWGLVGLHRGSSIAVSSLGEDDNDQDSEATEGEQNVGRIPLPDLHPSLRNLGDDVAADERRRAIPPGPVASGEGAGSSPMAADALAAGASDDGAVRALATDVPLRGTPQAPERRGARANSDG